jgi:hypothetical protein
MPAFIFNNLNCSQAQQNLSTTYKTQVGINATSSTGNPSLRRGWLMEWEIGADNVPNTTDCSINWRIDVMTAAGTSTAMATQPNDQGGGDAAAQLSYFANYTAEPTITTTSTLWYLPLNQRASYRIQMRDEWSAIITPAVALKGAALRAASTNYNSTVGWRGLIRE